MMNKRLDKFLNEMTVSTDISQYPELIKPVLYKVYTESLVSEIADIQPLNSPVGRFIRYFHLMELKQTNTLIQQIALLLFLVQIHYL